MSVNISYPAVANAVVVSFKAYKAAVENDSAKSVLDGTKKTMDDALKAHNALMDKAVYAAYLATEKPLDGICALGTSSKLVCKANEAKELVLTNIDQSISLHGFLSYAKVQKAKVTTGDDFLKLFYGLRYHINARVTKDLGGDVSKFKEAFGIVPPDVVGVVGKDKTSNTQLTLLLKAFMESLNSNLKVDNRDVDYVLYACTYRDRKALGSMVVVAEGTFWGIALDVYRRALDNKFTYTVDYKERKKAPAADTAAPAK